MNELSPTITFSFSIVVCKCDHFEFTEFATLNKNEIDFNGYEFTATLNIDIKR
jgi:hypothetical protein